eukprot:gene5879-9707_t
MSKKKSSKKVSLQDFLSEKTSKSWGEREEETPKEETKPTEEPKKIETQQLQPEQPKEQPKQEEQPRKYEEKPREQTQQKRVYEPVDESKVPTNPPFVAYVGNLSFKVIEDDIAHLFGEEGLASINIPLDRERGKPKGFAYVEFTTADALKAALKFNGTEFFQRDLRVDVSEQKQKSFGHRDEGFQQFRNNRYNKNDRENGSRYDTSRYTGGSTEEEPSKSDTEEKWSRKTKVQPKPKDFGGQSSKPTFSSSSSSFGDSQKKSVDKPKDLFGEGKAWEPKDDIEKKIEERLEREKEERRKRLEEEQSSRGGYQKKRYGDKKKYSSEDKEKKEFVRQQPKETKKSTASSNAFDALTEE